MDGAERIAAERERQKLLEGWTPEHDDEHDMRQMIKAAACYLDVADTAQVRDDAVEYHRFAPRSGIAFWPWHPDWWKPSADPIRNLEKAGALIAAEIDRLLRKRTADLDKRLDDLGVQ